MIEPRQILVTAALPYANGQIHLGHMVEYIQTDIWVRFQRLRGHDCKWMWADDTHGTAIMIRAKAEGRSEEALIEEMAANHRRDFDAFGLSYDNYGSTNSEESRKHCHVIWEKLRDAGLIEKRDVTQLFDPEAGTFLADRFVRGECPNCGADDQYGDSCEKCGASYSATDLINPKSALSGAEPVMKTAAHLFVRVEDLHDWLAEWTESGPLQDEVSNYLKGQFLSEPLRDWDVSRPAPYFGFEISDSPGDYWFVWFDAPIGYIGSTQQWCDANGEDIATYWDAEKSIREVVHFIGKDITYFHTLFWPAMLKSAGYKTPDRVQIHGFLTVNGEKMSKARGTFINASKYLDHLNPDYLRYYYAAKLGPTMADLDLDLDDFQQKVNSDLVGKVVNIASRCAKFVQKGNLAETYPDDGGLFEAGAKAGESIAAAYEACDYSGAMRQIMALADAANQYIERYAPWIHNTVLRTGSFQKYINEIEAIVQSHSDSDGDWSKDDTQLVYWAMWVENVAAADLDPPGDLSTISAIAEWCKTLSTEVATESATLISGEITDVCTVGLNLFRQIAIYLTPVLPTLAEQVGALLNDPITSWDQSQTPLTGTPVSKFKHLMQRVDPEKVKAMVEESAESLGGNEDAAALPGAEFNDSTEPLEKEPLEETKITIDDLMKIDFRVARIVECNHVEGADKLLQLTLSLGGDERRNVFAGIKAAYEPETLVGRQVIMVANLEPRKMRFGMSEGMVLASGPGKKDVFLLGVDEGAQPGHRVH